MSKRPKWNNLEHVVVGQEPRQLGSVAAGVDLHELGAAIAGGELNQAEPIAIGVQAQRLGVDGDDAGAGEASRR